MKLYKKEQSGILLFVEFYICVLLLASILAPIMFYVTKFLAEFCDWQLFKHFLKKDFWKFFERARLISVIFLIIPFLQRFKIERSRDFFFRKISKSTFFATFAISFALVLTIFGCLAQANVIFWRGNMLSISACGKFFFSAAVIAFFEETIFRGVLFNLIERDVSVTWTVVLTSFIFAYFHLKCESMSFGASDINVFSGFTCAAHSIVGVFENFNLLNFLNLIILGVILALILVKTGSIFPPIAFHMGAVFAIMNVRFFAKIVSLEGGQNVGFLDSWTTVGLQAFVAFCLYQSCKRHCSLI